MTADHRFMGQHVLSVSQFRRDDLVYVFREADRMREVVQDRGADKLLSGKFLANLFYEPSTRTSTSFAMAMKRLGGGVETINAVPMTKQKPDGSTETVNVMQFSSVTKGETLEDTVRALECYTDVIVLRHPDKGSAVRAAEVLKKPLINAGDGVGEHPTQALLDLYTILRERDGNLDEATVVMVGDLKHGRTVHSLARLLALHGVRQRFVSPPSLALPDELREELHTKGVVFDEHASLEEVIGGADVLYVTRVQKERFESEEQYRRVKDAYIISPDLMRLAKDDMMLMHPLPRVNEIWREVDRDPRAAYFRQVENGLYIRMALLAMVLGKA